jgi:hypothetical protein
VAGRRIVVKYGEFSWSVFIKSFRTIGMSNLAVHGVAVVGEHYFSLHCREKVTAAVVARNFTAVRIRREVFPDYV